MRSADREERPEGGEEHTFTFLMVPDRGQGNVWQVTLPLRRIRAMAGGIGAAFGILLLLAFVQALTLPRVLRHDELVGENLALQARAEAVEARLVEVEALVERVRGYDDRLRELGGKGLLPGFGPVDDAETFWEVDAMPATPADDTSASEVPAIVRAEALERALRAADAEITRLGPRVEEWAAAEAALPQIWPVEGVLTSSFGWRHFPFGGQWKFHSGLDIGAHTGEPILATADGVVTFADWSSGHGMMVVVDHGSGVTTRYCHASRFVAAPGDEVATGDVIALVGSTGLSTGPHLHYELWFDGEPVDPLGYLPEGGP